MDEFDCLICGGTHKVVTLIEFPEPEIVGQITRGDVQKDLDVIAKKAYLIGKEVILIECILTLEIIDDEDDLDMYVWVEVTEEEFLSHRSEFEAEKTVKLQGILDRYIPFYDYTIDLPVEVLVDPFDLEGDARIDKILVNNQLSQDLEKGISLDRLKEIISFLHHQV